MRDVSVEFGGHLTGREVESARGDDEGPLGSVQRVGNGLYGPAIRGGGAQEISPKGEVVFEGQVNHSVGRARDIVQQLKIIQTAALDFHARGDQGLGRGPRNEPVPRPGERS